MSQRYFLAKVTQRRQANMKFNRNKKLVDFVLTDPKPPLKRIPKTQLQNLSIPGISITRVASSASSSASPHSKLTPPDTKNYGRGLRGVKNFQLKPRPILPKPFPAQMGPVTLDSDSDDDEIEVIAEKIIAPPPRHKVKIVKVRSGPLGPVRLGGASRSSEKKKTVRGGPGPGSASKKAAVEVSDPFAEDEDLTCRVCSSAFWFRSQILEHLADKHHVKDPETFLREKRSKI